jgi:hypothetical protein
MYNMNSKKPKPKSRPLNLRNFPDELYWLAKACAASRKMSLKAYVVDAVEVATSRDSSRLSAMAQDLVRDQGKN